jgi:hypothetical protein
MNDDGSSHPAGVAATGSLRSSANPAGLEFLSSLHFATSVGRVARFLLMTWVLILLLPAMLILTVFAIMVTRGLGVPLYTPPANTMKKGRDYTPRLRR